MPENVRLAMKKISDCMTENNILAITKDDFLAYPQLLIWAKEVLSIHPEFLSSLGLSSPGDDHAFGKVQGSKGSSIVRDQSAMHAIASQRTSASDHSTAGGSPLESSAAHCVACPDVSETSRPQLFGDAQGGEGSSIADIEAPGGERSSMQDDSVHCREGSLMLDDDAHYSEGSSKQDKPSVEERNDDDNSHKSQEPEASGLWEHGCAHTTSKRKGRGVRAVGADVGAVEPDKEHSRKSCRHGRDNGAGHWMIFCEACAVWFHGICVGVVEADINQQTMWVCCRMCKYNLPGPLRSEALVGNSFKMVYDTDTECAKVNKSIMLKSDGTYGGDNSDEDEGHILECHPCVASRASHVVPVAEAGATTANARIATKVLAKTVLTANSRTNQSDEDEATTPHHNTSVVLIKILEPLATLVGARRMFKKAALSAVLLHIRNNTLFDPKDQEYVLVDIKLGALVGGCTRVKLLKLAKRIGRYIVDDDGQDEGGNDDAALEMCHILARHSSPLLLLLTLAHEHPLRLLLASCRLLRKGRRLGAT